ncbi:unnamed protein product [Rotaria socialis]
MTSSNATKSSSPADQADERKKDGDKFHTVLEHLYDSYNGYKACADDCTDSVFQEVSQKIAKIRSDFIGQLSSAIRNELGLEPVTWSSGLGKAHQTWIDVKAWSTDGRAGLVNGKIREILQEQLKTVQEQDAAVCNMVSSNPNMNSETVKHVTSADQHKKAGNKCQTVLEHLYDSYNGYKSCAEDCKDPVLQGVFKTISKIRSDFIGQLSTVIRSELNLEPVTSTSGLSMAHQTWVDIKAWFTDSRSKTSVVAKVHCGEINLIHEYEAALSESKLLDESVRQALQDQLKIIREQDAARGKQQTP